MEFAARLMQRSPMTIAGGNASSAGEAAAKAAPEVLIRAARGSADVERCAG